MGLTGMRGSLVAVGAVLLLIASAATLQGVREIRYPTAVATAEDGLYVTSGSAARRLSLGFDTLAADLYWIRAIQYYGGTKAKLSSPQSQMAPPVGVDGTLHAYPLLYPMLDLATTLDPKFNIAYRFGAIFLAEPYPGGADRPDLAIALLEKGLKVSTDKWEYMQDAGFVHYWWRQDYKAAAEWFDRASRVPGAPWWLRSLAANTLTEGGDRRSSRLMWETIRESTEVAWLKKDAERRLAQLQALDQIEALQRTLDQAAARGLALNWPALVRARIFPGTPVDPTGVPYEIAHAGRVQLSSKSTLYPPPREPQRLGPLS